MTDRELAGCPFCGGSGYWRNGRCEPSFYVACKSCETIGPVTITLETAIAAWNRRTPSSEGDGRDAARYRWLRDLPDGSPYECIGNMPGDRWDDEIDAGMKEQP